MPLDEAVVTLLLVLEICAATTVYLPASRCKRYTTDYICPCVYICPPTIAYESLYYFVCACAPVCTQFLLGAWGVCGFSFFFLVKNVFWAARKFTFDRQTNCNLFGYLHACNA